MACMVIGIGADDSECLPMNPPPNLIKALSIKQPFASLVVWGMKTLEIRSRKTNVRGRVVICSSLKPATQPMFHPEQYYHPLLLPSATVYLQQVASLVEYGMAIGMVDIVGCRPMVADDWKNACIEFQPGMYAWELANPCEIEPFPVTGQLGFFNLPAEKIRIKSTLK